MTEQEKPRFALKLVVDGKEREISYEELVLSNNLSQEALVSLLLKKKVISAEELLQEIERVKNERYRMMGEQ